jgi:RimJ/RimL family protein N-acetyltransferase
MTAELSFRTQRLELVAATLEHVLAEFSGRGALAALLKVQVPSSWPPGEYDRDALEFFKSKLESASPEEHGWYNWYVISLGTSGFGQSLVAGAGYFGPPSRGTVEIGYSVVPEARGQGYATEIVEALVAHAFKSQRVRSIIAHAQDTNEASSSVLRRCGFRAVGPGLAAGSTRYERRQSTTT